MKDTAEKGIKKRGIVPSILFFILSYLAFSLLMTGFIAVFFFYVINGMFEDEYDNDTQTAEIYEDRDDDGISSYIKKNKYTYIVRNKDGVVIDQQGIDSCARERTEFGFDPVGEPFIIYEDIADDSLRFNKIGPLVLPDISKVFKDGRWIDDPSIKNTISVFSLIKLNTEMATLPFWISVSLSDGSEFIYKCTMTILHQELMTMLIFYIGMLLFLLLIFISITANIRSNEKYRKEIKHYLLTDKITGSDNWTSFLMRGEQILKKSKNAGKGYAVLNLSIVKYRNYCMCHSLKEGERAMRRVSDKLNQCITDNKELAAHAATSNFALLLEMKDEESMNERINMIINALKKMDSDHTFQFQVGVMPIKPSIVDGRKQKRKTVQLEKYYNNASTARATMGHSDASGVVFFNKELI